MKLANPKSKHIAKAAQGNASTKALSRSVSEPMQGQKRRSTKAQHCRRVKAAKVVNRRSVHLINFYGGGTGNRLEIATALFLALLY